MSRTRPADADGPEPAREAAGPVPAEPSTREPSINASTTHEPATNEPATNEPLGQDERPDVGLAQSGSSEDAIVRRETEI
jgi:hypothetical protein